jgi:tetratricopeptide (TPR) repeat protein
MIVKNESKNIGRCLGSIAHAADEIIVVDTGSTDNTKEIAKQYGAKVYDFKWVDDFSKARNYSISKASSHWILILDGDDEFEKEDTDKLLNIINNSTEGDIFVFNTICYIGDTPGIEKIMNVNIRLLKNSPDIRYQGRIHEGIMPQDKNIITKFADIRVYHYGYLNSCVKEQNKRERNMRILKKELKKNPNSPYWLFCIGNEYFALNQLDKSLECFLSSYEKGNIQDIYMPKVLIRIIMIYDALGKSDEALKYIDITLGHYPQYTDVEFIRANIYKKLGNVTKAIRSFEQCLKLGEPPSTLNFLIGVGSYKSYYELGNIFYELNDYEEALKLYNQTLLVKNDFHSAIIKIGDIFSKIYTNPEDIKKNIEKFFNLNDPLNYSNLEEILFSAQQYQLALDYANAAIANNIRLPYMTFKKAMCMYNLKMYEASLKEFEKIDSDNTNYLDSQTMLFICYSVLDKFDAAENILSIIGNIDNYGKIYKVFSCLNSILKSGNKETLSEDVQESSEYLSIIINMLDAFLCVKEFDKFEKALELFNCIESSDILISLAKLYTKYGLIEMAVNEIKRSISIFDKLDEESAYILYRSFSYPLKEYKGD